MTIPNLGEKSKKCGTQAAFASAMEMSPVSLSEKLAEALDCSVAFLKGETECSDMTIDPKGLKNVPVDQVAKMLGKSRQFVRVSLQRGIAPFGFAVKLSGERFSYHISPKKLNEYIGS